MKSKAKEPGAQAPPKKKQVRSLKRPIRVLVNDDEREAIERLASMAGMPPSTYVRSAALGARIKSVYDADAVADLVRISGDLGRLGGLFKLWLTDRRGQLATVGDMNRMLADIRGLQEQIRSVLRRV